MAQDLQRISAALSNGNTTPFKLGQFDFGSRLNPPPCLIGRDTELATLRELASHAAERSTRCVLLAGPAGVGKSAMLDQLRPLVAQKACLVCSRFEQYGQDSASAALDIFRVLGQQLLAEPEEQLALYRARIAEGLGDSLGIGPSLLPVFQLLLGKHAAIELRDPREVEPRITQAALALLRAVASSGRPVVLIYDDVQWAPSVSRRLLDKIVAGLAPIPNLLLVCAYRDDEVVAGHPLGVLFERWRKLGLSPPQVVLNNLSAAAAREFVGAMLRMPEHEASELAAVLSERTQHNVYNTIEFLNALRQAGLLVPRNGRWHWDGASIRRDVGSASVADLLSRRIGKLTCEASELLQIVACLGVEASTSMLALASGLETTEVHRRLLPSLDDGLLISAPREPLLVRFASGRVQQAVLEGSGRSLPCTNCAQKARDVITSGRSKA